MKRTLGILFVLAGMAIGQQVSPMEVLQLGVPAGAKKIAYGTGSQQFGELRVPAGPGPHPVAVIVHGGCWLSRLEGLDERATALDLVRPMAAALAEAGFATWNVEYRRMGHEGGGWPGTFLDVAAGADHLKKIAKAERLDLTRVVTVGHSAGGHLALWLAGRGRLKKGGALWTADPLPVQGAVNLDGPGDLRAAAPMAKAVCGAPVVDELVGGQAERYGEASPRELLPLGARQQVLAGAMFGPLALEYEKAARAAGDDVKVEVLEQAGHFVFLDPRSEIWKKVVAAVKAAAGM